jgi:hypothetical protein
MEEIFGFLGIMVDNSKKDNSRSGGRITNNDNSGIMPLIPGIMPP